MATKPDNIVCFYSKEHGYVRLVRKSIGYYRWKSRDKKYYWRGQLVDHWHPWSEENREYLWFKKGQVIWLDTDLFIKWPGPEWAYYTNT